MASPILRARDLARKCPESRKDSSNGSQGSNGSTGRGLLQLVRNRSQSLQEPQDETLSPSALETRKMLTVREAAALLGVHKQTLRMWCREGRLRPRLTFGGHRRFDRDELLGVANGNGNGNGASAIVRLALCGRVSSGKQARPSGKNTEKSSLEHQQDRVEGWAKEKWGDLAVSQARRFYWQASGFNSEARVLVALVESILRGDFKNGFVVFTDKSRPMRYGVGLLKTICRAGECELVFSHPIEEKSAEDELVQDCLNLIIHFTSKVNGQKAAKICTKDIPPEAIVEFFKMIRAGYSQRTAMKILGETWKDANGKPYHYSILVARIKKNWAALNKLYPPDGTQTSFDRFFDERLKITENERVGITSLKIQAAYRKWCRAKGEPEVSNRAIGLSLKKRGLRRVDNGQHLTEWKRLALLPT